MNETDLADIAAANANAEERDRRVPAVRLAHPEATDVEIARWLD